MPKRSCDNGGSGGICLVHDGQEGCVEAATASTLRVRHRSEREEREREERALLGTTVHNGGIRVRPRNLPRSRAKGIVS